MYPKTVHVNRTVPENCTTVPYRTVPLNRTTLRRYMDIWFFWYQFILCAPHWKSQRAGLWRCQPTRLTILTRRSWRRTKHGSKLLVNGFKELSGHNLFVIIFLRDQHHIISYNSFVADSCNHSS